MASERSIEPAGTEEATEIRDELRRIGRMMWEDLDPHRAQFWLCRDAGRRIAWVGLEIDGASALLRSLYTVPHQRGRGIGRRLVRTAECEASARGAADIYLFSTGAGRFFQSLGYVEVPVSEAVAALGNTPQVEWYRARPELLDAEVTFAKALVPNKPLQPTRAASPFGKRATPDRGPRG